MVLAEAGHGLGWQPSKAAADGFKGFFLLLKGGENVPHRSP